MYVIKFDLVFVCSFYNDFMSMNRPFHRNTSFICSYSITLYCNGSRTWLLSSSTNYLEWQSSFKQL